MIQVSSLTDIFKHHLHHHHCQVSKTSSLYDPGHLPDGLPLLLRGRDHPVPLRAHLLHLHRHRRRLHLRLAAHVLWRVPGNYDNRNNHYYNHYLDAIIIINFIFICKSLLAVDIILLLSKATDYFVN